ncbi:unnamed protein product [Prorocentrum cordatum]|uniref:Uncharacterized protein n=1 Tax=Prorocentrum cordatum TaxID=2364126 RepID=A0ABN9TQN6_9DINO|nr:unnamed protein product [Polarella glacialis]
MFRFPFGVVIRLVSKTFKLRRPPRARGWGHGEGRDPPTAPQGRGPAADGVGRLPYGGARGRFYSRGALRRRGSRGRCRGTRALRL